MVSRFISIIVVVMATLACSYASLFNGPPQFTIKADKNKAFDKTCLIKTFTIKYGNIADCLEHCLEDCRCQSFQICQNTECQLCSSHKEENSSLLHDKHDCLYVTYEMKNSIQPSQNVKYAGLSCLMKYNCCQVSDICPETKICKTTWRLDKPWKRFTCECPDGYHGNSCSEPITSCAGYANGSRQPGLYKVVDPDGKVYEVYCHFDAYGAWTLVLFYSFVNRNMQQFRRPLFEDRPLSENMPTWRGYRLGKSRMENIKNDSKLFRFTCDYNNENHNVENSDFLQASLEHINIFQDTHTSEYPPNGPGYFGKIGGIKLEQCYVKLAKSQNWIFHAFIFRDMCPLLVYIRYTSPYNLQCPASSQRIPIFGAYDKNKCRSKEHVCTQSAKSTTQMWFGEA